MFKNILKIILLKDLKGLLISQILRYYVSNISNNILNDRNKFLKGLEGFWQNQN